jgi:hypothetical protein
MSFVLFSLSTGLLSMVSMVEGTLMSCDGYCQSLNGALSYCKNYQNPPVCSIRNQGCGPAVCTVATVTAPAAVAAPSVVANPAPAATATPVEAPKATAASSTGSLCTEALQNSFCQATVGTSSYCKAYQSPSYCQFSSTRCDCNVIGAWLVHGSDATIPPATLPVTQSVPLPATAPTTSTTSPSPSAPSQSTPMFLWAELPVGSLSTYASYLDHYTQLYNFVIAKPFNGLQITSVITRMIHPYWRTSSSAFDRPNFAVNQPSLDSPIFINLIKPLSTFNASGSSSPISLTMYPYISTSDEWNAWTSFTGTNDFIEGVFKFTSMWNEFLAQQNIMNVRFTKIVVDMEELNGDNYTKIYDASWISMLKSKYSFDFGVSIGFDQTAKLQQMASYVDSFYLQFYDFYKTVSGSTMNFVAQNPTTSPWLIYQNSPTLMKDYVIHTALTADHLRVYNSFGSQIYAMYSIQDLSSNCIYPLNGTCGINYELGSWQKNQIGAFIQQMADALGNMKGHGLFQFSFVRM